ncbi:MAG: succinate dehydrogenase cytochrome b subunit [Bdellovibrionales bacterium]|nr:succinate dehydrogenase cytochrome b subunit [Bdellovibrionales bacterium]
MHKKKGCFVGSTIGKKYWVALTGMGLSLFVLAHMLGNMLILVSPQKYNLYGHAMVNNPLIYPAEVGLVVLFFTHLLLAVRLTIANKKARPVTYAVSATELKSTSLVAKSMWAQGFLILAFTVLHLITFKYGTEYVVDYGGLVVRDLHRLVVEVFSQPLYVAWYVVCLIALGFHLSHGVASSIQTLGIHHPRYQERIKKFGLVYGLLVMIGFLSQPLYVFLIYKG